VETDHDTVIHDEKQAIVLKSDARRLADGIVKTCLARRLAPP